MQPREITIKTRALEFAAREWGDPKGKPVLALHGWLDNSASFTPLAMTEKLKGVRLIAPDLAGHGLSQHRPAGFSYDVWHYVEDVLDITEALGLERFGLIGHSLGGVVCTMATASVLKNRVSAMVLIDGISPTPRLPEQAPVSLADYIEQRRTPVEQLPVARYRSKRQAVRARAIGQYKVSRASAELLVERSIRTDGDEWVWTSDVRLKLASPARFTLEQSLAFIQAVSCPTHVVYVSGGEISDFIDRQQGNMPGFMFYPVTGTHHLHMDGHTDTVADIASTAFSEEVW